MRADATGRASSDWHSRDVFKGTVSDMSNDALLQELSELVSESRNADTTDMDILPTIDMLERINTEDARVIGAVRAVLPEVAQAAPVTAEPLEDFLAGVPANVKCPRAPARLARS